MNTTYLFYDCETSGLSPAFDQVLQFAAIRTDMAMQEISRHSFYVQLNPDTIPHPVALLTHQIGFQHCEEGLSEYEAIQHIHALMNTPGTISLGYNTMGFDDEFLRFSFFRNLLPPYTHQYANGCSRMDIYPLTVAYRLFNPNAIQWPSGTPVSLKLESIAKANGWNDGPAHDALNDVLMTIRLAQQLKKASPDTWDYLTQYFDKATALARIDAIAQQADELPVSLLMNGRFGHQKQYVCPAVYLGPHQVYRNQQCWLRLDHPDLLECTQNHLNEKAWTFMTKPGEPPFVLPCKSRFMEKLPEDTQRIMGDNLRYVQQQPQLLIAIRDHARSFEYPPIDHLDAYASLYAHGFWSRDESAWCERFHRLDWNEKAESIKNLQNPLLKALAIRMLGKHQLDALNDCDQAVFSAYLHERWQPTEPHHDHRGQKRFDAEAAMQSIEASIPMNQSQQQLLDSLRSYIQHGEDALAR